MLDSETPQACPSICPFIFLWQKIGMNIDSSCSQAEFEKSINWSKDESTEFCSSSINCNNKYVLVLFEYKADRYKRYDKS